MREFEFSGPNGNRLFITEDFLKNHKEICFIYADNKSRSGYAGSAVFRDLPNSYGFITKRMGIVKDKAFYRPDEYATVYRQEITKLLKFICDCDYEYFIIPKELGKDLSNKFGIYEHIIKPHLERDLFPYTYYVRFI